MGQIPWYLKFLSILVMDELLFSKYSLPSLASPPHGPSFNDIGLGHFMCPHQQNVDTNDVPVPSWGLMSYKMFPPATLGVANYVMTRTGPGEPLVQEEREKWGTNMKATGSLKQSHLGLLADLWATNTCCLYTLQVFCGSLLSSIIVSIAH